MTRLVGEDFDAIFRSFRRSAFRLETLPHYAVPDEAEAYAEFLAGKPYDLRWHEPWLATIAAATGAGRQVRRVRVMSEPPSDYQRFELAVTPHNLAAGEDIHILDADSARILDLPGHDFWLFDDARLVRMEFDRNGVFQHADVTDDRTAVDDHRQALDRALSRALPYRDYLAAHPVQ